LWIRPRRTKIEPGTRPVIHHVIHPTQPTANNLANSCQLNFKSEEERARERKIRY
jgi:hypothetical protein